jgi:hypothetical protein
MASITCRKLDRNFLAPHTHSSVAAVRRHYAATGDLWPCSWVIRDGWTEDGERHLRDCGELAWERADGGWKCEAGHEYTPSEVRAREGWDYAGDAYDAAVLREGGKEWRSAGPTTHIEGSEIERARREVFGR